MYWNVKDALEEEMSRLLKDFKNLNEYTISSKKVLVLVFVVLFHFY